MGQIANRTLAVLFFRLKDKLSGKKEEKDPRKNETTKGSK